MVKGLTIKTDRSGLAKLTKYLAGKCPAPYIITSDRRFASYVPSGLAISGIQIKRGRHKAQYEVTVKPLKRLRYTTDSLLERGVSGIFFQLTSEGLAGLTEYLLGEENISEVENKGPFKDILPRVDEELFVIDRMYVQFLNGAPLYGVHVSALRPQSEYEGRLINQKTQSLLEHVSRLRDT